MRVNQGSKKVVELLFRPSIVIFTDADVEGIYTSFKSLMLSLGLVAPLRKCIGILRTQDTQTAQHWLVSNMFASDGSIFDDPFQATSSPFHVALESLRQDVLSSHNQQHITEGEHRIDTDKPLQVYIVGNPATGVPGNVLKTLRSQLPDAEVFCLLCSVQPQRIDSSAPASSSGNNLPLSTSEKQRAVANFCYLYDNRPAQSTFVKKELYDYAIAQALYTLLTTSISSTEEFAEIIETKDSLEKQEGYTQFGTMSTCLITSPYEAAKDFCDIYLASKLVNWWEEDESKNITSYHNGISTWRTQPLLVHQDIGIQGNDPVQTISQQQDDLVSLIETWKGLSEEHSFSLPSINNINTLYKKKHKEFVAQEWLQCLFDEAQKRQSTWETSTTENWKSRNIVIHDELPKTIERIWLNSGDITSITGPGVAKPYLKNLLASLESPLLENRELIRADYQKIMTDIGARFRDDPSNNTILDDPYQLVTLEEEIKKDYIEKLDKQYALTPDWRTRIAASIVIAVVLLLMLLTLLSPLFVLICFISIVMVFVMINLLYARYFQQRMFAIQSELLNYCDQHYRYHHEQFEETIRTQSLKELKNQVTTLLRNCDKIHDSVVQLKMSLQREAERLEVAFFDTPRASHDIYVINGHPLVKHALESDRQSLTGLTKSISTQFTLDSARNQWNMYLFQWIQENPPLFEMQKAREKAVEIVRIITQNTTTDRTIGSAILKDKDNSATWNHLCQHRLILNCIP